MTRRAPVVPAAGAFQQARRDAVDSDRRIRIGRSSVLTAAMSPGATDEGQDLQAGEAVVFPVRDLRLRNA